MPWRHRLFLFAGLAAFAIGLASYFGGRAAYPAPPVLQPVPAASAAATVPEATVPASLAGPWYRSPPPATARPRQALASDPAPPKAVDRASLAYIGASKDMDGQATYFFKNTVNGQILLLAERTPRNGWTLESVDEDKFSVQGPGGKYEIMR